MKSDGYPARLLNWLLPPAQQRPPDLDLPAHVEQLLAARDNGERAAWLLACSQLVLFKNQTEIRCALRVAKFSLGVNYVNVEVAALNSVRREDGRHRHAMQTMLERVRRDLYIVAEAGEAI